MKINKDEYDFLESRFGSLPTVDELEICLCKEGGILHDICVRDANDMFCFQVCDKCYEVKLDEKAFAAYAGSQQSFSEFLRDLQA